MDIGVGPGKSSGDMKDREGGRKEGSERGRGAP